MSLSIVTAVCGRNEVTKHWLDTTIAKSGPHELVIVSNGSSEDENYQLSNWLTELNLYGWKTRLIRNKSPMGTTAAFDRGVRASTGSIVAMLHNDLEIKKEDWDKQVIKFMDDTVVVNRTIFANSMWCGVVGFVGAKRLGSMDIYRSPYELQQLARYDVYSSQDDAELHGKRITQPTKVTVLDGMALIIKKEVYEKIGGLDLNYVHHMYDNDLCLAAQKAKFTNWVIPIEVHHAGGMTSCGSEYGDWLREQMLTDGDIHKRSHQYFYNKWANQLPMSVA